MRTILATLSLLAFLVQPGLAAAKDGGSGPESSDDQSSRDRIEERDETRTEDRQVRTDERKEEIEVENETEFEQEPDRNRDTEKLGLFDFFRRDTTQSINEDRGNFLDAIKQDRDQLRDVRKEQVGNLKQSRAELEAIIKQKRDELKAQITEIKKERVDVRKAFVEEHFTTAISNLNSIASRIQTKIDELSDAGYDMTDAQKSLDAAEASHTLAVSAFAELKAAAVSDTDTATIASVRDMAKKVEGYLKETRDHFHDAIDTIKAALSDTDVEAEANVQATVE